MLVRESDLSMYGVVINHTTAQILNKLNSDPSITIQMYCTAAARLDSRLEATSKYGKSVRHRESLLSVVLYGPRCMGDAIGEFFSKCKMYLQDPLYCDFNVPYLNPHLLSRPGEEPVMTYEITPDELDISVEDITSKPSLMTVLKNDEVLPETEAPLSLATTLYRYNELFLCLFRCQMVM